MMTEAASHGAARRDVEIERERAKRLGGKVSILRECEREMECIAS